MTRGFAVGTLSLLTLLVTPRAAAGTPASKLVYSRVQGAEECADESALRRAVVARIGYDPFFPWAKTTVIVRVARLDAGRAFSATVDLVDENGIAHGSRVLESGGASCGPLLAATALAVSIAIDPQSLVAPARPPTGGVGEGTASAEGTEPAGEGPPVAPVSTPPRGARPAAGTEERPRLRGEPPKLGAEIAFGARGSLGSAPSAAVGGALGLGVVGGPVATWSGVDVRVSFAVEGRVDAPAGAAAPGGGRVRTWLPRGALVPCLRVGRLLGCGLAEVGSLRAESVEVADARAASSSWLAAGGRLGIDLPVGDVLAVRAGVDVVAPLRTATLRVNDAVAWSTPSVAASGALDLVVHFP